MIDVYMNDSITRMSIWILVVSTTILMIISAMSLYRFTYTSEEFWSEFRPRLIVWIVLTTVGILGLLLIRYYEY